MTPSQYIEARELFEALKEVGKYLTENEMQELEEKIITNIILIDFNNSSFKRGKVWADGQS